MYYYNYCCTQGQLVMVLSLTAFSIVTWSDVMVEISLPCTSFFESLYLRWWYYQPYLCCYWKNRTNQNQAINRSQKTIWLLSWGSTWSYPLSLKLASLLCMAGVFEKLCAAAAVLLEPLLCICCSRISVGWYHHNRMHSFFFFFVVIMIYRFGAAGCCWF